MEKAPYSSSSHLELNQGDWVEVDYDGSLYRGEIRKIEGNEYQVSVIPFGKFWKWPQQKDIIFYQRDKFIQKISPIVVNACGHFSFT